MAGGSVTRAVLKTPRLILRQITEADLDPHMALLNTPAVMEHLGGVQPRAVIAAKHAASRASFAAEGFGFMMMEERATGEIVGHCGLRRIVHALAPNPGDFEIGWLVREDRWRLGLAYEAMRAVVDWGFAVIGAPYIVAVTSAANAGSWRLMEKLGMERRPEFDFRPDPDIREADSRPDINHTIAYAIKRKQWTDRS